MIDICKLFYENKLSFFYFSLYVWACIKPTDIVMYYLLCKDTPDQEKTSNGKKALFSPSVIHNTYKIIGKRVRDPWQKKKKAPAFI